MTEQPLLRPVSGLAALSILVLTGCAPERVAQTPVITRDSAGIHIVESAAPSLPDGTWRVDTIPTVRIGQVDGPPEYQLFEVGPLARLADGTIVVASTTELRFYSAHGRWLRTVGRKGGGPGEYQGIQLLRRLHGDSLLVWDARLRRITVLAPDGTYVRDDQIGAVGGMATSVVAALEDGRLVTATTARIPHESSSYLRDTLVFALRPAAADTPRVPLARLRAREIQLELHGSTRVTGISIQLLPFSRDAHAAAGAGRIYLAESDRYEIRSFSADGAPAAILRVPGEPAPVTDALLDSLADYWRVQAAEEAAARGQAAPKRTPAQYREDIRHLTRVPTLPALSALLVDDEGNLWVREYDPPWHAQTGSSHWAVFSVDGTLRARLTTPPGLDVRCIQGNLVLGVVTDELGVEYVQGYQLETAATGSQ